ncbi:MAG: recombinase family protein, partial [Acidimicrobiales bacterium]
MLVRIGYGRVSTRDQNPDRQHDALVAAGCEQILVDKASGKLARRPALDQALLVARAGDQLVVTKLDRLGRSLEDLIALAKGLQAHKIDLVVLDQGIDTSTAVGRMFFQILAIIQATGCLNRASVSDRGHRLGALRHRERRCGERRGRTAELS